MWFNILKQPNLGIGMEGVGLINLDNVPEEEGRCKPRFLRLIDTLVNFFDIKAMKSNHTLQVDTKSYNFHRKEKYIYPLRQVWIAHLEDLEDSRYCEIMEEAKLNKWTLYSNGYEYLKIKYDPANIGRENTSLIIRLVWDRNGDKDYIRQIKENIANILKQ